jgi:transcription elongation factor Elf1
MSQLENDGNVTCADCGKAHASFFKSCPNCCTHDELRFTERYDFGWRLDVECAICGNDFDFSIEDLISNYKIVRLKAGD